VSSPSFTECAGAGHPTKDAAIFAARQLQAKKGHRYRAERRPLCEKWHAHLRPRRRLSGEHNRATRKRRNLRSRDWNED